LSVLQPDADRRLLPRWQSTATAIEAGELASPKTTPLEPIDDQHFQARKREWEAARSLDLAAELVGSGIVLGRMREVEAAARQILDPHSDASPSLREMAAVALETQPRAARQAPAQRRGQIDRPLVYQSISRLRHSLHRHPRNILGWVDLGRLYGILGQITQAERALSNALALGPNDRFTLRCAARFYVHIDDPEKGLALLQRARATKQDPWLMAAEIAVSQVSRRPSKSLTMASKSLGNAAWSLRSQSELKGSVATSFLYDGSLAKARRLFHESLVDPTENVVAQAQWASSRTSGLVIPSLALEVPHNFEANALRARAMGHWTHVLEDCWNWADYEPTSSRPMTLGSYIAAVVFGDADATLEFARRGVLAEPKNSMIRNNEVVALALLGRLEEAWSTFRDIAFDRETAPNQAVLLATMGLLLFRSGDVDEGREQYERALAQTSLRGERYLKALALWHLAQEEIVADTGEVTRALARAEDASKSIHDPELQMLGDRVRKLPRARRHGHD